MGIFNNRRYENEIPIGSETQYKEREQKIKDLEDTIKTSLIIQLTQTEKKRLKEASRKSGLSLSAFIRLTCLKEAKRILEEK